MELYKGMLVVATELWMGCGFDPMGPSGPDYMDLLGIVTEVDRENRVAMVETKRNGCFATVPFENLIPLVELVGKEYDDPEEALRDFLPEVIVRIATMAHGTSRGLTETIRSLDSIARR